MSDAKTVYDTIVSAGQDGFEFRICQGWAGGPVIVSSSRGERKNDKIICAGGSIGRDRNSLHDDRIMVWNIESALAEIRAYEKGSAVRIDTAPRGEETT